MFNIKKVTAPPLPDGQGLYPVNTLYMVSTDQITFSLYLTTKTGDALTHLWSKTDADGLYAPTSHTHTEYDLAGSAAAAQAAAATDATTKVNNAVTTLKGGVVTAGDSLSKLYALIQQIQTLLTSDNVNLDTIQEIVNFIEVHQTDLDALGLSKVNVSDIVNTLADTSTNKPLSAAMGKALNDALGGKEPTITAGTASQYWKGTKTWADLSTDVRAVVLTGLSTATNAVITAADSLLVALGKVQAQINAMQTTLSNKLNSNDASVTNAREWTAATVTQAVAEAGLDTTRNAWTAQRVRQAIVAWWATVTISKTNVGLDQVDNTSDLNKPISTATQTALNAKEPTITAGTTAQYWRGDKSWRDFATDVRGSILTGLSNLVGTAVVATDSVIVAVGKLQVQITTNLATLTSHTGNSANPHGVTAAQVGLGNVNNTADLDKPISTATQTALNSKEGTIAAGTTAQFWRGDKSWQDLATAIRAAVLTGLSTATSSAIVAADSVIVAFGKLQAQITTLTTTVSGKESSITAGTTAQFWRGDKSWQDLATAVRASVLTGLSTATATVITATDSVLTGLGKVQAQITANLTTLTSHTGNTSNPHSVTAAQVGLGNVDNTSDASKPISTATQSALDLKANDNTVVKLSGDQTIAGIKTFSSTIQASISGNAGSASAAPWSGITGKPTTISGYGITDALALGSTAGAAPGTASAGIATTAARSDHVHPIQTTVSGNAGTATKLATARSINGVAFDGTANITINAVDATARIASSEKGVANGVATLDANGLIPSTQLPSYVDDVLEYAALANFPATGETAKIYVDSGTNKIYRWTGTVYIEISPTAGNSDTATKLATARSIAISGDATWSVTFDGSANVTSALTLSNSGVTAGTYPKVTVDGKGRVTAGTTLLATDIPSLDWTKITTGKPTTIAGYGISDAAPSSHVGATGAAHGVVTTSVNGFMSSTDKTKLDGIATGANNYTHPSGDGNLHVPANGTTNNAKFLKSGATAGTYTWEFVTKTDVGLANVDNTSDANKPVSTATQSALNLKLNTSSYTAADVLTKLKTVDGAGSGLDADTIDGLDSAAFALTGHNHDAAYQPLDADLTAIAALAGTSGLLKKTAANIWALDLNTYLTANQSITVSGDASGTGTTAIALTLANSGVTAGTYPKVTVDAKGRVTAGASLVASDIPNLDWAKITSGKPITLAGYGIIDGAIHANFANTSSYSLRALDLRTVSDPSTGLGYAGGGRFRFGFNNDVDFGAGYADIIDLSTYNDNTGGGVNALYLGKGAQGIVHKYAAAGATAWTAKTLAYTDSSITGNAGTATKLATARSISLSTDATGSASFDGSANATIAVTLANSGVTAGTYPKVTVDAKGRVTAGASLAASDIPSLDWSKITTGKPTTLAGYGITDAIQSSGNALPLAQGDLTSSTLTTSTTTANQVADSFAIATYRSAKYIVQLTSGTAYQVAEIMVIHDGTNAYINEYGTIATGANLATFDADISAGNLRLLVTPVNAATTIKAVRTSIDI